MDKIERKLPVRVSAIVLSLILYVFTVFSVSFWGAPAAETFEGLIAMCGVLGIFVAGDTYRPSGIVKKQ